MTDTLGFDNYIINRPWEKIIDKYDLNDIISVITDKGIIPDDFILKTLKPIFLSKNLPLNITLKEFYNTNNIDFHLYTSNINGKYIQQSISNSHARGFALDLGTLFDTPFGFRLGTSISNFGPKLKMTGDDLLIGADVDENMEGNNESVTSTLSTDYFDLPLVLRIGISDQFKFGNQHSITFSMDAVSPNDNANYLNVGIKMNILNGLITLYGGLNSLLLDNAESEFCFGGGLRIPQILNNALSINYTHEEMKFLGNSQQISISFNY